jgi:hypothetical protein
MLVAFSFSPVCLASVAEDRREYSRTAATVEHSNDCERFFIGRVSDYVIPHGLKLQWPCREVGTAVAYVGKRDERLDRFIDFFTHAIGSVEVIGGDLFPDFFQIFIRLWVEDESAHGRARRASLLLLRRRLAKASSPSTGLTRPLLRSS